MKPLRTPDPLPQFHFVVASEDGGLFGLTLDGYTKHHALKRAKELMGASSRVYPTPRNQQVGIQTIGHGARLHHKSEFEVVVTGPIVHPDQRALQVAA